MAFIDKKDAVVLNIMLTSKGRELLSTGNLNFKYFTVGDSEIDYNFIREINSDNTYPDFNITDVGILRPKDKNPKIISNITKTITGSTYNEINTISPVTYDVINQQNPIGFFNGTSFLIDDAHVKQPDLMIYMSGVTGGSTIRLKKSITYGACVKEPAVGDLLFIMWTYDNNTTGYTFSKNSPTQNLMYKIESKIGTLNNNNIVVTVDRNVPDLFGYNPIGVASAMVFSSGITQNIQQSTNYLSESVLNFLENYECGIEKFPFWNMSIVYTEEIAGIGIGDRKFGQFKTKKFGGFVSYIQNQASYYKKLGIIHYTNNSPANTYGEEFNINTPVLDIPMVMWHKSSGSTMGLKLIASGNGKVLTGSTKSLDINYYDLADSTSGVVVGKIFIGLKVFVIEDQELLFAMSYKSNRSWTLPDYRLTSSGSPC